MTITCCISVIVADEDMVFPDDRKSRLVVPTVENSRNRRDLRGFPSHKRQSSMHMRWYAAGISASGMRCDAFPAPGRTGVQAQASRSGRPATSGRRRVVRTAVLRYALANPHSSPRGNSPEASPEPWPLSLSATPISMTADRSQGRSVPKRHPPRPTYPSRQPVRQQRHAPG